MTATCRGRSSGHRFLAACGRRVVEFVSDGSSGFVAMRVAPESMNRARSSCIVREQAAGWSLGVVVYLDGSMVRLRNNHGAPLGVEKNPKSKIQNTKYTCDRGQTRNKLENSSRAARLCGPCTRMTHAWSASVDLVELPVASDIAGIQVRKSVFCPGQGWHRRPGKRTGTLQKPP